MHNDPIVDGVRDVREKLAARHGYDIRRIMADARKRQLKYQDRLVSLEKQDATIVPKSGATRPKKRVKA